MSYLDWHVGMKVVCIDIAWPDHAPDLVRRGVRFPEAGRIYTIREMLPHPSDQRIFVRLNEIQNPVISYRGSSPQEVCFGARRFRPIQKRKTDISCFAALLNDQKHEEPA